MIHSLRSKMYKATHHQNKRNTHMNYEEGNGSPPNFEEEKYNLGQSSAKPSMLKRDTQEHKIDGENLAKH